MDRQKVEAFAAVVGTTSDREAGLRAGSPENWSRRGGRTFNLRTGTRGDGSCGGPRLRRVGRDKADDHRRRGASLGRRS